MAECSCGRGQANVSTGVLKGMGRFPADGPNFICEACLDENEGRLFKPFQPGSAEVENWESDFMAWLETRAWED